MTYLLIPVLQNFAFKFAIIKCLFFSNSVNNVLQLNTFCLEDSPMASGVYTIKSNHATGRWSFEWISPEIVMHRPQTQICSHTLWMNSRATYLGKITCHSHQEHIFRRL